MFSVGPNQILLILLIVVIIFGAKKLPEIGGGLGKAIRNFKRASTEPDEIDISENQQDSAKKSANQTNMTEPSTQNTNQPKNISENKPQ